MIVEFIGCTGAGKSTLIKAVQSQLAYSTQTNTSVEFVTGMVGLEHIKHPTVQNLIQELVCFPFFVTSFSQHKDYINFTVRQFRRNSPTTFHTINNYRSLVRKIGIYELCKRYKQDRLILVDEGPIQAAHMFAFSEKQMVPDEIASFTRYFPLPDLVVYVKASLESLIERTKRRPDPPREMALDDPDAVERFIRNAISIFDQIVQQERILPHQITVVNQTSSKAEYDNMVNYIVEFILKKLKKSSFS